MFFMSANLESIMLVVFLGRAACARRFSPVASPAATSCRGQLVVGGEHAGIVVAERDDDGAGQRRQIDHEAAA